MNWLEFKSYLSDATVSRDALHIYAALIIQVGAALIVRVPLSRLLPWFAVLLVELINEGLDLLLEKEPYIHGWQIAGSIHDLFNTMVLPTILLLLVRYVPRLFDPRGRPKQEHD
jgi:hypothetical protein